MNDETDPNDDDLERLLAGLPLRAPSAALDRRITDGAAHRPRPALRWALAATVALAAGVAIAVPAFRRGPAPIARVAPASPVAVEREVSQTIDEGAVTVVGHVPYRRVRQQTVREIWWADPATGARMWAQLPTEHITVEPAEVF